MAVLNRHHGNIPTGAVYIGRGSKWGNPFIIGRDGTREDVCEKYKIRLWEQLKDGRVTIQELAGLHGKDLVCFCSPLRCHGHVLEKAAAWAYAILQE